jgi:hypothetical protein
MDPALLKKAKLQAKKEKVDDIMVVFLSLMNQNISKICFLMPS